MATRQLRQLVERGNYPVGNLSSLKVRTITNGAIVEGGEIGNFTMVELGFNEAGERIAKTLSDVSKKTYLIAAVERRYLGEEMVDFINDEGEHVRIVILDEGLRFESSEFELNAGVAGVTEIKNGQVAHFNPATKKYVISDATAPHADYANADAKLLVVSNEEDIEYTLGKPVVRFEVQ